MIKAEIGDLRVWHSPQEHVKHFVVHVKDVFEAKKILNVLADYDLFQSDNEVRSKYFYNDQGLEVFGEYGWCKWRDEDGNDSVDEYIEKMTEKMRGESKKSEKSNV